MPTATETYRNAYKECVSSKGKLSPLNPDGTLPAKLTEQMEPGTKYWTGACKKTVTYKAPVFTTVEFSGLRLESSMLRDSDGQWHSKPAQLSTLFGDVPGLAVTNETRYVAVMKDGTFHVEEDIMNLAFVCESTGEIALACLSLPIPLTPM